MYKISTLPNLKLIQLTLCLSIGVVCQGWIPTPYIMCLWGAFFFFNPPLGYGYDDGINSAIQVCHLLDNQNKKMSEIISDLPKTFQSPTMAPFCKDEEKYSVVEEIIKIIKETKNKKTKIDDQEIEEILTVNGIRFSFEDGSWGLIRASSNKPSLVVVTESPTSDKRKKKIFDFIDDLLQKTGKIGEYDQKI